MKILLAHPGTQYSYQLAKQLYQRNMLYEFHTGIAYGKDSWVFKWGSKLPSSIFRKLSNRFVAGVPDRLIRRHPLVELKALIKVKAGSEEEKTLYRRNYRFQISIPRNKIKNATAVIGFDTSSWVLAARCKEMSRPFFLDVSIGHPLSKDKVYRRVTELYPDLKFTVKKKPDEFIAFEEKEMQLATHIVVASGFTFHTYVENGMPANKLSINPYGVDIDSFKPRQKTRKTGDSLKFVFVGLVDARKGIPFLLETWRKITSSNAELTLIGPLSAEIEKHIRSHYPMVIVKGRLSFNEMKNILPDYDVMVFPSFFEGFGLVIPEAMASGLPVITTTATCGPDIIKNGEEGFVLEPGNEVQLKEAIEYFIQQPGKVNEMGNLSRARAKNFTWDSYGERWVHILNSIVGENSTPSREILIK